MEKLTTYQEATQFLFSQLPMFQRIGSSAYKAGLDNTLALDHYFHHPHRSYKTIHIAGTNGKGSVSHLLASVLMEAGYSVGLYTSPHLKDFRERIRVNGIMIEEDEVIDFVNKHQALITSLHPSFFEMTAAMAFHYFASKKIDFGIIEVGLGGRLDSTNIIIPELSIVTNISFDHMQLLGNTLPLIASEKAGIIKPGIPVVVGQMIDETRPVFIQAAALNQSPLISAEDEYQITDSSTTPDFHQLFHVFRNKIVEFENLKCPLMGYYQRKNIVTLLAAIDQLKIRGIQIPKESIYQGVLHVIRNTGLAGRWQLMGHNPLMICDTAHNEDGIRMVTSQIKEMNYEKLHMVIGMVNDKDIQSVLALLPVDATYYFTKASVPRSLHPTELQKIAAAYHLSGNCYPDVPSAIQAAKKSASPNDLIFIGGSTFIVADAL